MEPDTYAAVEEDGTSGLVTEVSEDSDKVSADVVLLHGCPQRCVPNPAEGLLEVYEDMVEVLLVLEWPTTVNVLVSVPLEEKSVSQCPVGPDSHWLCSNDIYRISAMLQCHWFKF